MKTFLIPALGMGLIVCTAACGSRTDRPRPGESPTAQWVEETGSATIDYEGRPAAQARHEAILAAEAQARGKLRARVAEIEVRPGETIEDSLARDRYKESKVLGALQATRSHEQTYPSEGEVAVRMKIDLDYIRRICLAGEEAEPLPGFIPLAPAATPAGAAAPATPVPAQPAPMPRFDYIPDPELLPIPPPALTPDPALNAD